MEAEFFFSVEHDVLKLFPALTAEQETVREGLDILEACLSDCKESGHDRRQPPDIV